MTDIVMSCHLGPSGISRAAQEFYKCLSAKGMKVVPSWLSPPDPNGVDPSLFGAMTAAASHPYDPGPVHLFVGLPHALRTLKDGSMLIGSVVAEGNTLSAVQARACQAMDVVAVPSSFCKAACLASGVPRRKIAFLPYPLDTSRWNHEVKVRDASPGRAFRFLWMNTWYSRKGWDVMLRAWWEEFTALDNVELVVKSYQENARKEPLAAIIASYAQRLGVDMSLRARIVPYDGVIPDASLPAFMASFDAYVSPHRSEGFGMNPWYAMALGVPVICTDYGGTTDFVKEDTGWPVKTCGVASPSPEEEADFPQLAGTKWAEPDADDLKRAMRRCASSPDERRKKALAGALLVAEKYSPESVAARFAKAVESVSAEAAKGLIPPPLLTPGERFVSADIPFRMDEL